MADLKFHVLALFERSEPGATRYMRVVHEDVRFVIIRGDEPDALGCVETFHATLRHVETPDIETRPTSIVLPTALEIKATRNPTGVDTPAPLATSQRHGADEEASLSPVGTICAF